MMVGRGVCGVYEALVRRQEVEEAVGGQKSKKPTGQA